jgi:hypothetical protein
MNEFPYTFGEGWKEIRKLIDQKHPDWGIARAAK